MVDLPGVPTTGPTTSNTLTKAASDVLSSYGDVGTGVYNDIMAGAGPNAFMVLNQIPQCPLLVLWGHGAGILQGVAAIAAGGVPLCTVLQQLQPIFNQPVTPHTYAVIRPLRLLRFGYGGFGWRGGLWSGRVHGAPSGMVGAEPTHAGEHLPDIAGYRKDIYYRTGQGDGTTFQGGPGGRGFPGNLAACWAGNANRWHELRKVWNGPKQTLANVLIGTRTAKINGKDTVIPDSLPDDVYAIPTSWGDPPTTKACWNSDFESTLGQGIIGPNGVLVWFPYGTAIDCGSIVTGWVDSGGKCGPSAPLPTPCLPGEVPVVRRGSLTPVCEPKATCDPATQDYDPLTNSCKPKPNVQPPVSAAGGAGWLVLAILVAGGLGAGLYINEHGKHKGAKASHAGAVGGF